jgi:small subunit ribosomal protein S18
MAEFSRFGARPKLTKETSTGTIIVDYKEVDGLRRTMTPNGKIQGRKRTGLNSKDQRMVANAIKRARYMALLPFTSATL